ncbi:MAG TPA: hypothetical protein VEL80_07125 [Burkholderiales bacterium]|nr:hypothetical protein [Burkholderiales bacterium]
MNRFSLLYATIWVTSINFCVGFVLSVFGVGAIAESISVAANADSLCRPTDIASARVVGESPALIAPGRQLQIKPRNFDTWFDCRQQEKVAVPVLYLDHVAVPDIDGLVDPSSKALRYSLRLTDKNRSIWATAAANAVKEQGAAVGLGTSTMETSAITDADMSGEGSAKSVNVHFQIAMSDQHASLIGWAYVIILLVISVAIAWLTRLLRDRGVLAPGAVEWGRSYSLARTQLFLWTVTVAGVAGFLWITTGMLPTLNVETLALLGISAGTSGAAAIVEGRASEPATVKATAGFFLLDLLDDGGGVSVHRFQAVLANAGLAIIFAEESIRKFDFYTIPQSWAGLLALSSGVYLGLKVGEPK